jgi:hypothetical protein
MMQENSSAFLLCRYVFILESDKTAGDFSFNPYPQEHNYQEWNKSQQ